MNRRRALAFGALWAAGAAGAAGAAASPAGRLAQATPDAGPGARAPDFTLPELGETPAAGDRRAPSGRTRSLGEFAGRVVWLDFWASWCGPCRLSFPWLDAMQAKHGARGLQVVAINLDRVEDDALRFLAERPVRFLVLRDAAAATPIAYRVAAMPTGVLIGRDGLILSRHAGFSTAAGARLEALIDEALGARA